MSGPSSPSTPSPSDASPSVEHLPPHPPGSSTDRGLRRNAALVAVGGLLFLVGGVVLLVLWPGVVQGSFVTVALGPVTVAIAIGAALVGYAVSARPPRRRSASLRVGVTAIAIGIVVFALLMMLSVGALPGLYYPSPGSSRLAVDGCGGKGAPAARAYPGFPPDSHVELRWATGNGTPMQFTLWQKSPNSDRVAWQLAENGSFGQVSFVGDGGAAGWSSAGSAKTCPTDHIEYFTVSWSYTLAL